MTRDVAMRIYQKRVKENFRGRVDPEEANWPENWRRSDRPLSPAELAYTQRALTDDPT